jgi:DNA-binding IscR family transcriptional regulator
MMTGCALRSVWTEVRDATIEILDGVTFAELAELAERAGGPWMDPALLDD